MSAYMSDSLRREIANIYVKDLFGKTEQSLMDLVNSLGDTLYFNCYGENLDKMESLPESYFKRYNFITVRIPKGSNFQFISEDFKAIGIQVTRSSRYLSFESLLSKERPFPYHCTIPDIPTELYTKLTELSTLKEQEHISISNTLKNFDDVQRYIETYPGMQDVVNRARGLCELDVISKLEELASHDQESK